MPLSSVYPTRASRKVSFRAQRGISLCFGADRRRKIRARILAALGMTLRGVSRKRSATRPFNRPSTISHRQSSCHSESFHLLLVQVNSQSGSVRNLEIAVLGTQFLASNSFAQRGFFLHHKLGNQGVGDRIQE